MSGGYEEVTPRPRVNREKFIRSNSHAEDSALLGLTGSA